MTKKPKKINKKSKKYKDLDYKQSRLKSALHENWRQYYKYRQLKSRGDKVKSSISMKKLESQQSEINRIREEIGKSPITLIRDFKKTLRNLKKK